MRLVVVDGDQRIKTVAHRCRQALGHAFRQQRPGLVSGSAYRAAQHRIGRPENVLVAEPGARARLRAGFREATLDALLNGLQRGDRLIVSELSRLGRSLGQITRHSCSVSAAASFARLLHVQRRGEVGSPRVKRIHERFERGLNAGLILLNASRPAPGRRMRPVGSSPPAISRRCRASRWLSPCVGGSFSARRGPGSDHCPNPTPNTP